MTEPKQGEHQRPGGAHLVFFFFVAAVEEIKEIPRSGARRRGVLLLRLLVFGDFRVLRGGLPLLEDSPEQPGGHADGAFGRGLGFGIELGLPGD